MPIHKILSDDSPASSHATGMVASRKCQELIRDIANCEGDG